jgi:hypothetical protein
MNFFLNNSGDKLMKRKDLLLLTVLLTQTTPVWAMWNEADENAINVAGNGKKIISVRHINFDICSLPKRNAPNPAAAEMGIAQQRVAVTYENDNQSVEIILPTQYPLHGQQIFQEDRDNNQSHDTLILKAFIQDELREVFRRSDIVPHELIYSAPEIPGWNYFDGEKVYEVRSKLQGWRNPQTRKEYRQSALSHHAISSHQDYEVIYVEPFAIGDSPLKAKDDYRGSYYFMCDLAEHKGLTGKKTGNLLYSDGMHVYLLHTTQELWMGENGHTAGFFIASYKKDQRLNFLYPEAKRSSSLLPQGLYQLICVQEGPDQRVESWQKLGENSKPITIEVPLGVSSIPGMGNFAPRKIVGSNTICAPIDSQNELEKCQILGSREQGFECTINDMKAECSQRVTNHCLNLIKNHQSSIWDLRENLRSIVDTLKDLKTCNLSNSIASLRNIIDVDQIINEINALITKKNEWSSVLSSIIQKIEYFIAPPQVNYENGILSINGPLVGVSDFISFLDEKTPRQINVFALHTLVVDANFTSHGTDVYMIAPSWKIVGERIIDLSGLKGRDGASGLPGTGADGQPGDPGGNGGHFYGKGFIFERLPYLAVNTYGGPGGNGGDGGDGPNGIDGKNADINKVTSLYRGDLGRWWGDFIWFHNEKGEDGTPGGDGGKGGAAGMGGYGGIICIGDANGHGNDGETGKPGKAGLGGKGGMHGKSTYGYSSPGGLWLQGQYTPVAHVSRDPSKFPNGNPGQGLKTFGQQQINVQTILDRSELIKKYSAYYYEGAKDRNSPCGIFPNLVPQIEGKSRRPSGSNTVSSISTSLENIKENNFESSLTQSDIQSKSKPRRLTSGNTVPIGIPCNLDNTVINNADDSVIQSTSQIKDRKRGNTGGNGVGK